ncbi:MAG: hypothetical protein NVS2B14_04060 [Chamaesiphon sp.]
MLVSIAWAVWQQYQHPNSYSTGTLQYLLFYYILFLAVDFLACLVAFMLERQEDWQLLVWLLLQRFLYRQLMYYVALKTTIMAIKGKIVSWGKAERKATVA